jgi:putative membrane protein
VDETADAIRRTRLANERTYLAWWRSGLTAFAVSIGAGKLVPAVASGPSWPFETLGAAFGVLGVAFVALGFARQRAVDAALARGEYAELREPLALGLTAAGLLLGVGTVLAVVLVNS